MIIPDDGCLPPITRKGFAAFNNVMIIKVPEKLRKPGETCYQLATLDRSKKGERWPADQYVDIIMNTPLSKETNTDSVEKASSSNDYKAPQKNNFQNKGIFRPKRFQSCPKNFNRFSRRNRHQRMRLTSPPVVPTDEANFNRFPMSNAFHSSTVPYEENSAQYNENAFDDNQRYRYPGRKFSNEHFPREGSFVRDSSINPFPERRDAKTTNAAVSKEPLIKIPPYHNDFDPRNNRPPPSKSPYNNYSSDFNPHINRPPPSKSPYNNFPSDFNPLSNELPAPNPPFNNFQGIPPPFPNVFEPNPNMQWDHNNAQHYPIVGHDEIRRNGNYEAFPTDHPIKQEFLNSNFNKPTYPNALEPEMNNSFNNPRNDCHPPFNPREDDNPPFNNQPYPFQYEDYKNNQNGEYPLNEDYKNTQNARNNFNRRNRNFNYSHRQNGNFRKNHRNEKRPWRGNGGNKFSEGNNNRRGNNKYQRRDFREHWSQENQSQFHHDGP